MKEKTFKKGDRVKWVGIGNGSRVPHEGVVTRVLGLMRLLGYSDLVPVVEVSEARGFHKITGKPRKARLYRVRTSLLTLVKR